MQNVVFDTWIVAAGATLLGKTSPCRRKSDKDKPPNHNPRTASISPPQPVAGGQCERWPGGQVARFGQPLAWVCRPCWRKTRSCGRGSKTLRTVHERPEPPARNDNVGTPEPWAKLQLLDGEWRAGRSAAAGGEGPGSMGRARAGLSECVSRSCASTDRSQSRRRRRA